MLKAITFPLSAFALFLGLMCVPFLALPPFGYGIFQQVEPLTVALWFLGGAGALWCFVAHLKRPSLMDRIFSKPVVWLQIPFVVYVFVQSLFLPSPLLSWVGTPNLAQGGFTFTALFFLTPPLVMLSKIKVYSKPMFLIATGACLFLSTLTILGSMDSPITSLRYSSWCPVLFPDYIAFGIVALGGLYWAFKDSFGNAYIYHVFFLVTLGLGSYYSYNLSIFVAYILAILTYVVVRYGPFQGINPLKRFGFYVFSGLLVLTFFLSTYDIISPYLPEKLQDQASLTSRLYLAKMTFIDFSYRSVDLSYLKDFLFGKGWGSFNNATLSNIFLVNDISLFSGSTWKPTWEFLDRDLLHSHNFLLETFLASGLVGLVIFIYTKYRLILALRKEYFFSGLFFLTSYFVVSAFWFEMLHTLPFVILTTTFLFSAASSGESFSFKGWAYIVRYGSFLGTMLIPVSVVFLFFVLQMESLKLNRGDDLIERMESFINSPIVSYDLVLGGFRSTYIGRSLGAEMKGTLEYLEKERKRGEDGDEKKNFARLDKDERTENLPSKESQIESIVTTNSALANKFVDVERPEVSLNALILSLNILTELASHRDFAAFFHQNKSSIESWEKVSHYVHDLMPFRTDVLSPYFNYLLSTHQRQKLLKMTEKSLNNNPDDSIAYWYEGLVRLKTEADSSLGLSCLKQAINLGVTRFLPIPKKEVESIMQAQ